MSGFPNSPRLQKGAIVGLDPVNPLASVVVFQYNPETVTRTLVPQTSGGQAAGMAGAPGEAMRLTGPPQETIKLDVQIDATDQLERAEAPATGFGIHPQLAALETMVYPDSAQLQINNSLASAGTLEIAPAQAPLSLFVWSRNRVLPVRIMEFSITEEAFDPLLNPIRAKVSLGLRVMSINDLPFDHKGSSLFLAYQQQKENLARRSQSTALNVLGITSIT